MKRTGTDSPKKGKAGKRYHVGIGTKNLLFFLLFLILFSVDVCYIGYRSVTRAMLEEGLEHGNSVARTAALLVDADRLDEYLDTGGDSREYRQTWDRFDRMCNNMGATFIYVIRPDENYNYVTYIFSTVNHDSKYWPYDVGFIKSVVFEDNREAYRAIMEGEKDSLGIVLNSGAFAASSHHITSMVPLKGDDGSAKAILCVQVQMSVLVRHRNRFIKDVILRTVILAIIFLFANRVHQWLTLEKPLRTVMQEATRFASENVIAEKKLTEEIRRRDEIGQLADSIDQMEEQTVQYINDLMAATKERERAGAELTLATRIQSGMLPSTFPAFPDRTEFDVYASMDPAREVGGDFYDFFLIDDDHLALVIADVSGKGVPAALFMMAAKIILQSHAKLGETPAQILANANEAVCARNDAEMFVTVWLGILEISTGRLTAANAGHEFPVLRKPDGAFELYKDRHGFVIGGMEGVRYREYEIQLEPGARLFVYTDGVPEATNAKEEMFGTDRMLDALNTEADASPQEILKNVRVAVDDFVQDAEQFDDLTMLCLEYRGPQTKAGEDNAE